MKQYRMGSKRSRKNYNYWNHNCIIVLLAIITMICARYVTNSHVTAGSDETTAMDCSEHTACVKCTGETSRCCSWSIERQTCLNTKQVRPGPGATGGGLMVHNETHCPRFSVVEKSAVAGTSFRYTVRISNDDRGGSVAALLRASKITCCLETCDFDGLVVDDEIVCAEVHAPSSYFLNRTRALVMYVYITFNGVKLKFDEEAEYYYPIYDRECVAEHRDEGCATCLWNDQGGGDGGDGGYAHYLKWCPAGNRCTGSYQVYDKRETRSHEKCRAAGDDVRVECTDLEIQSFEPLRVPRTGGTTMRIAVRNHLMLEEGKTIGVTVAGRECADPVTAVDNETIVCTVVTAHIEDGGSLQQIGPVQVTYASSVARFTLTSVDSLIFVDPVVTTVRPVCGSPDGGTVLTVTGRFLDAGAEVRVSVVTGEAAVVCETVARGTDSITCRTGASRTLDVRGRVLVEFDGHLRKYAVPEGFAYVDGDPAVDAGQVFEGTVSGGTAIPVRGSHLTCLERATFYVIDRHGDRRYAATPCRVLNDSLMVCRAPTLDRVLFAAETSTYLQFGVGAQDFAGLSFELLLHGPAEAGFVLHADPVYTDFETDDVSATLTINGHGRGYRAEDVDVRLRNSTGSACAVTEVALDRVVCTSTLPPADLKGVRGIVVYVGDRFVGVVEKKSTRNWVTNRMKTLGASCGVFVAVLVIAVLLTLSALLFRLKMKKQYTLK